MQNDKKDNNLQKNNKAGNITMGMISLILGNWKKVVVITVIFVIFGLLNGFVIQKPEVTTFSVSEEIFYDDYEYYPNDFQKLYTNSLNEYVIQEKGSSKISGVSLTYQKVFSGRYTQFLKLNFAPGTTYAEADEYLEYVEEWHNMIMNEELTRVIMLKEGKLNYISSEFNNAQEQYIDFVYKEDGYFEVNNNVGRLREIADLKKTQVENLNIIIKKNRNSTPLVLDEKEYENYSEEQLHDIADALQDEIEEYENLLNNNIAVLGEMIAEESLLGLTKDNLQKQIETNSVELKNLYSELDSIDAYYIHDLNVITTTQNNWKYSLVVSFILGLIFSVIFVMLKESYQDYKNS